jgi:uncharacterized protein (DUF952 family)
MTRDTHRFVYKIAPHTVWFEACRTGAYHGSADDQRDGFIHLSALHQLEGTLARHFKGQADLVLIGYATDALGADLRWEPSRDGDLFPHLYAALPTSLAQTSYELTLDADGLPVVPEDLRQC